MSHERSFQLVYIPELKAHGLIIQMGAHCSKVRYFEGGLMFEELMDNSDFITKKEVNLGYEDE